MSTATLPVPAPAAPPGAGVRPVIEIVVPVLDEAQVLERSIRRLHAHVHRDLPYPTAITVVDNGSSDGTWEIAVRLAHELAGVHAMHLDQRGRGRALRVAWSSSDADVVAYMDVDLSTDLRALLPLVAPLVSGHSDIATGSRLARGARVVRGARRELISRCYNALVHATLGLGVRDAQCGFKALRAEAAWMLLPQVRDDGWFFDTELLVLAQRAGLRTVEIPVDWTDDPDSRVDILRTARDDLRGIARMLRTPRFAATPPPGPALSGGGR